MSAPTLDTIVNLAKRRGIAFQSSEIYGGLRSTWDYGPLGVELKDNVKRAWWKSMVQLREDVVGLDASILMHPRVWEASGHVESFTDPLVECMNCHHRFRADHLPDPPVCPDCGHKVFTDPRNFNLMFKTYAGPVEDAGALVWLRPETAQGIFVDFLQVQAVSRKKIPFGIAQRGKSFRNEITPGNFIFRTREFEQMELEYFVKPGTDEEAHQRWIDERFGWYQRLGIRPEKLRLREHGADELSHYSKRTVDIEYAFPWGWAELEGIANRGDFDLSQHAKYSGQDLSYFDAEANERYVPYVIEPSAGADRGLLAFLVDAYREEEVTTASGKTEKRTVLALHKDLAPYKVAVLPLSRHENLVPKAKEVAGLLRPRFMIDYDDAGSIGRRYRRQDEIGTPYAVTVDFDSLEDGAVTVRDRDSMTQDRVPIAGLVAYLDDRLPG
ncbi:MAG TPA: glycine--tRNA ligase [Actinomycetota bacterium]|nr:glycine--tRNA ligase [Actinomycetota bacterium]